MRRNLCNHLVAYSIAQLRRHGDMSNPIDVVRFPNRCWARRQHRVGYTRSCKKELSVGTRAATVCELTAETRWIQSSHQKEVPPIQREAKRMATAMTGIMPVTYAVILIAFVYESWGRLQMVACNRSISAGLLMTLRNDVVLDIPNVWSTVHFSIKHGCKIVVEFLELHWHSTSKRPHPMRGKPAEIHSSCPG